MAKSEVEKQAKQMLENGLNTQVSFPLSSFYVLYYSSLEEWDVGCKIATFKIGL